MPRKYKPTGRPRGRPPLRPEDRRQQVTLYLAATTARWLGLEAQRLEVGPGAVVDALLEEAHARRMRLAGRRLLAVRP